MPQFFSVDSFSVVVQRRYNARGEQITVSEADVKLFINGDEEPLWSVAEGNGPVNALDTALRKDLGRYSKHIRAIELVDYKVRILTGGTEAVTRVSGRKPRHRHRQAMDHGRRVAQHHRCQLRGAAGLDQLQAAEGRGRSARMKSCAAKEPHG